jgi:hypothetical protein
MHVAGQGTLANSDYYLVMKSARNADSKSMNRRAETRFQVFSRVQVIPLDRPENPVGASLIDMSGAGFRLLADVELPLEKMIVVETDAHLILAEVRNSLKSGSRYATGLRKLHTISMLDLPQGAGRLESIQILINEYVQRKPTELPVPAVSALEANQASNPAGQEKCPPLAPILTTGDPQSDPNLKPSTVAALTAFPEVSCTPLINPVPHSHEPSRLVPERRGSCLPVWSKGPATSSAASLKSDPAVPAYDPLTGLRVASIPALLSQSRATPSPHSRW